MRISIRNLLMALALIVWPIAAFAQSPSDVQAVRDTISAQVEAFQANDPATAFSFASPFIQRRFGSAERFGTMVKQAYPMVWDPGAVSFVDQVERGPAIWQMVQFIDKSGGEHWFAYEMVDVGGAWRINGVFPIDPPELAA